MKPARRVSKEDKLIIQHSESLRSVWTFLIIRAVVECVRNCCQYLVIGPKHLMLARIMCRAQDANLDDFGSCLNDKGFWLRIRQYPRHLPDRTRDSGLQFRQA